MSQRLKLILIVISVMCILAPTPVPISAKSSVERAGDIGQVLIPASAFGATCFVGDTEGRHQFYKSFFSTLGTTYLLKYVIDRDRPEGHGENAFPSGHTSVAFQGAVFIQRRYGWTYGIPAGLAATFVGWSRIEGESDKHDALDVFAGGVLGTIMSYYFTKRYEKVEVATSIENGTCSMGLMVKW